MRRLILLRIIAIIGLLFIVAGIILMLFQIRVALDIINEENSYFRLNLPEPIIDAPAYIFAGLVLIFIGGIVTLISGILSKEHFLWITLVVLGVFTILALIALLVIPLYSPYSHKEITVMDIVIFIIWALPGLICIFGGIYLFRADNKRKSEIDRQ